MNIGERLKELRIKSNYTQLNIAEFLGVDQSLISKVEKNERVLTSDMLEKLASLYGLQLQDLLNNPNAQPLSYAFRSSDMASEDMKIISTINSIALNSAFLENLLNKKEGKNND
jgi:transcriptional regulator with XRE-family HTH domain